MKNAVTVRTDEIIITAPINCIKIDGEEPCLTRLSFSATTRTSAGAKARKILKAKGFTFDRSMGSWFKEPEQRWMKWQRFRVYAFADKFKGGGSAMILEDRRGCRG